MRDTFELNQPYKETKSTMQVTRFQAVSKIKGYIPPLPNDNFVKCAI